MIRPVRRIHPFAPAALGACLALLVGSALARAEERAYVLDTKGQALLAVDLRTGEVKTRTVLEGTPAELITTADGSRLVTLDPGPHKTTFCCGYQPKGPIVATIFDATSLQRVAGVDVGWGMPTFRLSSGFELLSPHAALLPSADGRRATILCAGYRSKKPEETLPRELVTIELGTGRVAGKVALDRPAELLGRIGDTETAVLLARGKAGKEPKASEVLFVDLEKQAVVERLPLAGELSRTLVTSDGAWLYLLDPGKPSNKQEKNVDGSLYVVSLTERKLVGVLDAGSNPRGPIWEDERQLALLPSDGPPVAKGLVRKGELRVLKAGQLAATIEVAAEPHLVRDAGSRTYVVGEEAISIVSLDELRRVGEILLEHAGGIDELVFSPDQKRAFALYGASSRLSVLDLEGPRLVGSVGTGRGGVKFGKALGAMALSVAATTASYYQGQTVAQTQGQRYFTYNTYNFGVAPPETSVAVRSDGAFVYALNTQTNDVTVVDAATATVLSKEPAKGRTLSPLTGGTTLAVLGRDELRLIDTRTHKASEALPFEDAEQVRLLFTQDGLTAVAYGGKDLYLLDGRTGAVQARVSGLLSVTAVLFGKAPAGPQAQP